VEKGHGRCEKRTLKATTWLTEYLAKDWPGCAQLYRLERERRGSNEVEREVVFGITSLRPEQARASELLRLIRAHWGIENGLHGRRDGTLREEACRIRKLSAPQVMAIVRNLTIYLSTYAGKESLAAATRYHMCHPEASIRLVTTLVRK
jgi:hypothetical protein